MSLNSLAKLTSLSRNYLCTVFHRESGVGLNAYITQVKLERSALILLTEDVTVAEAARRVGYKHCSYFCRTFRSYFGVTPGAYRALHKKTENGERGTEA